MPRNKRPLATLTDGEVLRLVARWLAARANGDAPELPPYTEAAARLYIIARRVPLWTARKDER